jgi:hypothetical protein
MQLLLGIFCVLPVHCLPMPSGQVGQMYILRLLIILCPFNTVLEIDTVGTYNMCKAVYDHCFKVHAHAHVVIKSDKLDTVQF